MYHDQKFYEEYERKKKNGESLITHILKNSNAENIDPYADNDNWAIEWLSDAISAFNN